jgi:hypothetical protein
LFAAFTPCVQFPFPVRFPKPSNEYVWLHADPPVAAADANRFRLSYE